jgi:ATP:corrinoid adenosyltransferase
MAEDKTNEQAHLRSRDEIALEMMKFIAVTTGYGKGTGTAGFTGKATKTSEEYADSLMQLFQKCRSVLDSK